MDHYPCYEGKGKKGKKRNCHKIKPFKKFRGARNSGGAGGKRLGNDAVVEKIMIDGNNHAHGRKGQDIVWKFFVVPGQNTDTQNYNERIH